MTYHPPVEEVRKIRDTYDCGLADAKAILVGRELRRLVDEPLGEAQLREILHTLIDKIYPS